MGLGGNSSAELDLADDDLVDLDLLPVVLALLVLLVLLPLPLPVDLEAVADFLLSFWRDA